MALSIKSLLESWNGMGVVMRFDPATGTWIFIALHNDTLGRPTGGTRMKVYQSAAAGLRDAMRLAEGMTHKWAAIDFGYGGGKAVLAIPRRLKRAEREGLLRRYGRLLTSLRGSFGTGMDLGTTTEDMLVIGEETEYVHGVDREKRRAVDPGPYTARGVFASLRATLRRVFGSDDMAGRVIHVQGVGDVGGPLARMLSGAGAKLILTDLDTRRAEQLADELGNAETFEPHTAYQVPCDVYAPCAIGGTLNAETVASLKCRIVCGSANNQLDEWDDAVHLHERGILYAPDFVVNAGGAAAFALIGQGESDGERILARVDKIGESLERILDAAQKANHSPVVAARDVVHQRLEQGADKGGQGRLAADMH